MYWYRIFILLLVLAPGCFKGQNSLLWRTPILNKPQEVFSFTVRRPALSSKIKAPGLFRYDVPQLAFFCDMENKFRNRFKLYLKLRAGNDEMYREMIR